MSGKNNTKNRISGRIGKSMEGPVKRFTGSVAGSVGIGLAAGTSAGGVLFGKGELFVEKVGDATIAIPKGVVSAVKHYMHAPEYVEQASNALDYLREEGPRVVSELGRAGRYIEGGTRQLQRATTDLNEARDYITPGGDLGFDPQQAIYSARDGLRTLETAVESLNEGKSQIQETIEPAMEVLKDVDLNPIIQIGQNFLDNMAPDEISQTIGIGAAALTAGYLGTQYVRSYWGRRGRPGIISRWIQRKGIKEFSDHYEEHPEQIAGQEAVDVFETHLVRNPDKLENLAREAGYKMVPKESDSYE